MKAYFTFAVAVVFSSLAQAESCPMFHCNAEAQSAMALDLAQAPHSIAWQNASSGKIAAQGCGGNGSVLACVFKQDLDGTGTVKVFNPATQTRIWGSASSGYNPRALFSAIGQVPLIQSDGSLIVSDDARVTRYNLSTGAVLNSLTLSGTNFSASLGVVPLSGNIGVGNNMNGTLTAFDLTTLVKKSSLSLRTSGRTNLLLSSVSTGHQSRAYAVGQLGTSGLMNSYLFGIQSTNGTLSKAWEFAYKGSTGASPVILPAALTGRPYPLILLHTPAPAGATAYNHQLVGIEDRGSSAVQVFAISLPDAIEVTPAVDSFNRRLYINVVNDNILRSYDFDGVLMSSLDIRTLIPAGIDGSDFQLNGHVVGTYTSASQTVLLSAGGAAGQYVIGLDPVSQTAKFVTQIYSSVEDYTAAWTIQEGTNNCPIVAAPTSGITMLCP